MVVGGGAAGFFAALQAARALPAGAVAILEKSAEFLTKVRISGGGRCNVTHACFDTMEFSARYPRGGRALIGPFQRFQARDTIRWFAERGATLKTEADGRMFPVTDSSATIVDCLLAEARRRGVVLRAKTGVRTVERIPGDGFRLILEDGEWIGCRALLLATGGARTPAAAGLATALGHTLNPPVPSLFTFKIPTPWLTGLSGVSVDPVQITVPAAKLKERGPLLITHQGLSGPAVLRLSAWGARKLHDLGHRFDLLLNWLPRLDTEAVGRELDSLRQRHPAKLIVNTPAGGLPSRLWEQLVLVAGIAPDTRWSALTRNERHRLTEQLTRTTLSVTGKNTNKDEFVTCGGVKLKEVDFQTMESRKCPGLYFAGELLDIDGVTGGFNFQAAWTTGWIAGNALAAAINSQTVA